MLDIGLGEVLLIAVLALLVFGPDRLPKVASDAARALRQVRQMATTARRDLADAAGLEKDEELSGMVSDLRELDPRRVLEPLPPQRSAASPAPTRRPAPDVPSAAGGPAPAEAGGRGATVPGDQPAGVDPDWT